jgi:uncharacterized SAM-binding protein YcdF (DUF218 family)
MVLSGSAFGVVMADVINWVFEAAHFEMLTKALTLVLLVSSAFVLWEIVRYLRTLRLEREFAWRLTMQQVYGTNDPRYADWQSHAAPRRGVFGRAVRKTVQAVGVLSILIGLAAAVTLPFLGGWLESQGHPERADYILPLPGDQGRLIKAAELYKQGFAPRILLSREQGASGDVYASQLRVLEREGVPGTSVVPLGSAQTEIAETADAFRTFAEGRKIKAIVVASGIQSLRTRVIFENVVPRARFIVMSAPDASVERPWWSSQESAIRTVLEATQLAQYWFGSHLRTPAEPETPAAEPRSSQASTPSASTQIPSTDGRRQ